MFHVNPNTGIADHCKAQTPDSCPFGAGLHAETRDEIGKVYEDYVRNDEDPETEELFTVRKGVQSRDPIGYTTMAAWHVPTALEAEDEEKRIGRKKKFKTAMATAAITAGVVGLGAAVGVEGSMLAGSVAIGAAAAPVWIKLARLSLESEAKEVGEKMMRDKANRARQNVALGRA